MIANRTSNKNPTSSLRVSVAALLAIGVASACSVETAAEPSKAESASVGFQPPGEPHGGGCFDVTIWNYTQVGDYAGSCEKAQASARDAFRAAADTECAQQSQICSLHARFSYVTSVDDCEASADTSQGGFTARAHGYAICETVDSPHDPSAPSDDAAAAASDKLPPCAGHHDIECPDGLTCVDIPADGCDLNSVDAGCAGLCVPPGTTLSPIDGACGGSTGLTCVPGSECLSPELECEGCSGICKAIQY